MNSGIEFLIVAQQKALTPALMDLKTGLPPENRTAIPKVRRITVIAAMLS